MNVLLKLSMDLFSKNSFRMNVVLHFLDVLKFPPFIIQLVVVLFFIFLDT